MLGIFSSKVSPRRKQSLQGWILIAWLGVWTQRTAGQGPGAEVVTAAVEQTAILTAPVTAGILVFSWYRGTGTPGSQLIIGYTVPTSEQIIGPQSTGRESASPDGTLSIRDLQESDAGNYTVSVTRTDATVTTASRQLRVYAWLGVWTQRTAGQGPGVDEVKAAVGQMATLKAPVTEDILVFTWYGGLGTTQSQLIIGYTVPTSTQTNGPLFMDRMSVSPDGTLTIRDLQTSDAGNYTVSVTRTNTITTTAYRQLSLYGMDLPPTGSPCPTPGSCWQTTLGVACGVLLGAAIIVAVMAVHYERRLKQMATNKDENMYQNPSAIKNADTQYENVKKGRDGQSANPESAADSAYMELKHGDRATYEQIKRP